MNEQLQRAMQVLLNAYSINRAANLSAAQTKAVTEEIYRLREVEDAMIRIAEAAGERVAADVESYEDGGLLLRVPEHEQRVGLREVPGRESRHIEHS